MKSNIIGQASITVQAPASNVWAALTQPELISQYFFGTNTHTDWKVGSSIRFTGEWNGKKYEDKGNVLNIETNKFIKYNYWSSMSGIDDKPENYVEITYDLNELNGKTILTVVQENIPDEKMKAHSEENWQKVLQGLKELVEKKTAPKVSTVL